MKFEKNMNTIFEISNEDVVEILNKLNKEDLKDILRNVDMETRSSVTDTIICSEYLNDCSFDEVKRVISECDDETKLFIAMALEKQINAIIGSGKFELSINSHVKALNGNSQKVIKNVLEKIDTDTRKTIYDIIVSPKDKGCVHFTESDGYKLKELLRSICYDENNSIEDIADILICGADYLGKLYQALELIGTSESDSKFMRKHPNVDTGRIRYHFHRVVQPEQISRMPDYQIKHLIELLDTRCTKVIYDTIVNKREDTVDSD